MLSHIWERGGALSRHLVIAVVAVLVAASVAGPALTEPATAAGSAPARGTAAVDPLIVVDVGGLSVEEQLTFASLQGIVNRSAPTLYLVGLRSAQDFDLDPSAEAWLADAVPLSTERISPTEALQRLLPRTAGLVVWDPAVPYESQDVATTIAGLDDLVPVDPTAAARYVTDFGASIQRDLRDLHLTSGYAFIEWAMANLHPATPYAFPVWTGRPRNGKAIQPGLRDWAVKNRAFVFDADPASESMLLRRVFAMFPHGTPVYGYPFFDTEVYRRTGLAINESIAAALVADAGHWLVPTTDAANLSVHAQLGPATAKAKWDDAPRTPAPDKTYVSFTISDGDAMGYDQTLLRHLHLDHLGSTTVPIGVSISPYLAADAPRIWDWLMTNTPDRVRFVAGPSGAGYAYPYAMRDLDGYLDHSKAMLDATGLRSTWVLDPPLTASPSPAELERFVSRTSPSLLLTDYGGNPPEPPTVSFTGGVPVVHTVLIPNSTFDIAGIIRSVAATQPSGARFVSIGLTTWRTKVADAEAAMAALGDGFVAVPPDAFAGYLRGAYASGYRGSAEPPRATVEPAAGECRATVTDLDGAGDPFARRFLARLLASTSIESAMRIVDDGAGSATFTVDTEAIARTAKAFAASNFAVAYPTGTADSARISVALRGLKVDGTDITAGGDVVVDADAPNGVASLPLRGSSSTIIGRDALLSATVEVRATYDPGDGALSVVVTGPVGCRPLEVAATTPVSTSEVGSGPPPAAIAPVTPGFTG